jgi:hypothetical protein
MQSVKPAMNLTFAQALTRLGKRFDMDVRAFLALPRATVIEWAESLGATYVMEYWQHRFLIGEDRWTGRVQRTKLIERLGAESLVAVAGVAGCSVQELIRRAEVGV